MRSPTPVRSRSVPALLAGLLLAGCFGDDRVAGGTGVGNPPQASVTFAIQASAPAPAAKRGDRAPDTQPPEAIRYNGDGSFTVRDAGGTAFTIRRSIAHISRIRIKLPEGLRCGDHIEEECAEDGIELKGSRIADLMAGTLAPDPGTLRLPVGGYSLVELRLEEAKDSAAPAELKGSSMIVSGTFSYKGDTARAFSLRLDFDEEARFGTGSARVVENAANRFVVQLDVGRWVAAANITGCLDEGLLALDSLGGLTLDDENSCGDLEKDIKEGVKSSGNLEDSH